MQLTPEYDYKVTILLTTEHTEIEALKKVKTIVLLLALSSMNKIVRNSVLSVSLW